VAVGSGPAIGAELGGYRLEALVGRGGMSAVYRAVDLRLGRRVALKFLAPELAQDARFRERFLGESRLAASIDHAGIVPIFEAGEADGLLYIAMRYVEGTDLRALLRSDAPLAPDRAVALVAQIAGALDAAHAQGLVHRDVKPSNALVAVESGVEHVYLADFGLTKHTTSRGGATTASGQLVGTVDYVAPEQIRGDEVDGRADLYSLGCVLFECLTGQVPFPRRSEVATIYAHLEEEAPRPSARCPDVSPALDTVVARALAKDPARRWQSGAELAAAARGALLATARPLRTPRAPRPAVLAAIGAIAVVAAIVAAVLLARSGTGGSTLAAIEANAVAVIDPGHASLIAQVQTGASPSQIASGAGAVWVTNANEGTVSRIDPRTHTVRKTITVGSGPGAIAVGDGSVWVVNSFSGTLSRIDPAVNRVVKDVTVGNGPSGVCAAAGAIWVANSGDGTVWRIDPHTTRRTKRIPVDAAPTQLACGGGAVWASSESAGKVTEIDARTGDVVRPVDVGNGASGVAYGAGAVWVANTLDGTVSRIDPRLGVPTTFPIGSSDGPASVAADAHDVWVSNEFGGTVTQLDPKRGTVLDRLTIGSRPQGIALVDGALWVGVAASGAQHRGGTLRVLSPLTFGRVDFDPATQDSVLTNGLINITNDGLTAFRRVGGVSGWTLVPDLAATLPTPTDGGRTYRFELRRGIRYSTGALVRPADIRRELERSFHAGPASLGATFFGAIDGAAACARRRRACDLSHGIVVDDAAGTITFHLTSPDPDFLYKLALPTAVAVPDVGAAIPQGRPLPATGPYAIARLQPTRFVRLVRNPHFRAWSTAAKPDGYPGEIAVGLGVKQDAAVRAVERGQADYVFGEVAQSPRKEVDELFTRYASQVHTNAGLGLVSFFLNTRVPPFDNVYARRALNYAVDRHAALALAGGSRAASVTCQILPANFPAYRPYCPYTAHPGPGRPWSAPDLAKARRLVARSHTRGMRVTVWAPKLLLSRQARFIVPVLDALGYHASVRLLGEESYFPYIANSRNHAQLGATFWAPDYPAARDFLELQYSCRSFARDDPANFDWSEFCDPRADRLMKRAAHLQSTDPRAANAMWARAERRIVNQAPVLPLDTLKQVDVVSRRVGNYQSNPEWGVFFDQLWVR
jgi:YVTN family beta-propeller protein